MIFKDNSLAIMLKMETLDRKILVSNLTLTDWSWNAISTALNNICNGYIDFKAFF